MCSPGGLCRAMAGRCPELPCSSQPGGLEGQVVGGGRGRKPSGSVGSWSARADPAACWQLGVPRLTSQFLADLGFVHVIPEVPGLHVTSDCVLPQRRDMTDRRNPERTGSPRLPALLAYQQCYVSTALKPLLLTDFASHWESLSGSLKTMD